MFARLAAVAGAAWLLAVGVAIAQDKAPAKADAGPDRKAQLERGQQIARAMCAACHLVDGNSNAPANPKLAGQIVEYMHKQLRDYKPVQGRKPARDNALMAGMVAGLSDADMRAVALWYSTQKLRPAVARDKDLAALGQKIYRGGNPASGVAACAGCHGPTGAGIPIQYPRLAGQFPEYLEQQLIAFRSGVRANDPNGMMRGVAQRMTDREIKAVAEYLAGLR